MSLSSTILDSLVLLISSSVEAVKREYARKGQDLPSLDSFERHTADSEPPSLELKKAVQALEGACAQLTSTIAPPAHTIINRAMGVFELACLRVVTETKVADHLKPYGDKGLCLSELSLKTGVETKKLGRILRLLATKHIFKEVKSNVFANNRLSIFLESADEISSTTLHFTEECFKAAEELPSALSDPEYGPSYAPDKAPITKAYGFEPGETLFRWYAENPKFGSRFGRAMIGWENGTSSGSLRTAYPWFDVPASSTVADVGGGIGAISMDLARAFPCLNFVIQDLPETIEQGQKFWQENYPEAIQEERVRLMSMDFFVDPPVEGSDIYYLKHIIHNWNDKQSIQILNNVRKAMKPCSKVLIHEYILQHVHRGSQADVRFTQAPKPLLPNYGVGRLRQYNLDLCMMALLNAKERTLDEYIELGEHAGLRFLKAYDTGETGIVEFVLA